MLAIVKKRLAQRKILTPWLKGSRKSVWAFGIAALGVPLLAIADFVMLGDQFSQSFGGNGQGYITVLACLGGIVLLPMPIAYFMCGLLCRNPEKQEHGEKKSTRVVKAVIAATLSLACWVLRGHHRLSAFSSASKPGCSRAYSLNPSQFTERFGDRLKRGFIQQDPNKLRVANAPADNTIDHVERVLFLPHVGESFVPGS